MLNLRLNTSSSSWLLVGIAFVMLYMPTYTKLFSTVWQTEEQGHGPLILLMSAFLMWQKRGVFLASVDKNPNWILGAVFLAFALLTYVLGRSQGILLLEVGSQILVLMAIVYLATGGNGLRKLWFPIFFLLFLIPLPATVVDALTLPMKIAVSNVSEYVLYHLDYPIARNGVILQIGYYKLLVADACAGLHTVFTLEAMGLLYLHLIKRDSFFRNVTLATLIIPISFFANTVRVIILVLVTYYYGDEMGQGFIHDFAGFVLFGTALILIIFVDTFIHFLEKKLNKYNQKKLS